MPSAAFTNAFSRVWFQPGGPGPSRDRQYHGNWKAGAVSWNHGDLTIIREPDPASYGRFIRVGRFRGEPKDPEVPIMARYDYQRSALMDASRGECEHALHIHMGQCENPQDFARGWEKILLLEGAAVTNYTTEALGALGPNENAVVNEDTVFVGTDLYEVNRLQVATITPAAVTREITAVSVCDNPQCGTCGISSDGCQTVYALEGAITASPGLVPRLYYSKDGGNTWAFSSITTLAANQQGSDVRCMGGVTVVISADDGAIHWCNTSDLLAGVASWTRVTTGFVTAHNPLAMWTLGATETWIVGRGGYIYFTDDPTQGVTVNNAGAATAQDLNDVHFSDSLHGLAVGANNAVVYTTNAGGSWSAPTGPNVAIVLNTCWIRNQNEWLAGDATGKLWYTIDGGNTWTQKHFAGDGVGQVRRVRFSTPSVGWMAHSTATPTGRLLRTLDGGFSWYVLPEGSGSIPANQYIKALGTCADPNVLFGGGLASNAIGGIAVKAA